MPTNSCEIIMQENNSITQEIGSEIELTFENTTKKYKLVGIVSNLDSGEIGKIKELNIEKILNSLTKAVTVLERKDINNNDIVNCYILTNNINDIYATTEKLATNLNLDRISNIDKSMENIQSKTGINSKFINELITSVKQEEEKNGLNIQENKQDSNEKIIYNTDLLNYELVFNQNSSFKFSLIKIGIILGLIIALAGFTTIYRAFRLNYEEMAKEFAMYNSIGMIKKQIMKMTLKRNSILAIIGIVIGITVSIIFTYILFLILQSFINNISNGSIDFSIGDNFYNIVVSSNVRLELSLSFELLFLITIIIYIIVLISGILPMKKINRTNLIEVIKMNDNKHKKSKMTNIINKIFGYSGVLAYKNIKRKKLNYRAIIISITVSVSMFLVTYGFINNLYEKVKDKRFDDYKISVPYEILENVIQTLNEANLISEYYVSTQDEYGYVNIYIATDYPYNIDEKMKELKNKFEGYGIDSINLYAMKISTRSNQIIIEIILYAFSTMISIFSIINIIDTIIANMLLRKKEFFILQSIGMEKKQINKMLITEGIFYGTVSIIYSLIISSVLLYIT